jgi:UDP-glucuronate 4-epimerase
LKILVTGTAGFIGYHLALRLLRRGDEVVGIDSINDYYDVQLKLGRLADSGISKDEINYNRIISSTKYPNYRFIKLNLEDKEGIENLFYKEKFNRVVNLAGQAGVRYSLQNPFAYMQSNVVGFLNVLEYCRYNEVEHLVYASSSSVYGMNGKTPFSASDPVEHPVSLYAATKISNELMAHAYSHLYRIPTTGLRFFTVYGPWGRPDMALFLFTKAIIENKPIQVFNHGKMIRDFTFIDDIVSGILLVVDNPARPNLDWDDQNPDPSSSKAPYKIYNIGHSHPVGLMDYITEIEKCLGKKAQKEFLPVQKGDVLKTYSDVSDLQKELGYKSNTMIEQGVKEFVGWYLDYYGKNKN